MKDDLDEDDIEPDFRPKNDWVKFIPAFLMLLLMITLIWRGVSSFQWPVVDGHLVRSVKGYASGRSSWGYTLDVYYSYIVKNKSYSNHSVLSNLTADDITAFRQQSAEGSQLTIHYNSQNPADAVLHPGYQAFEYVPAAAAFLFLALTAAFNRYPGRSRYYDDVGNGLELVKESRRSNAKLCSATSTVAVSNSSARLHSPLLDQDQI